MRAISPLTLAGTARPNRLPIPPVSQRSGAAALRLGAALALLLGCALPATSLNAAAAVAPQATEVYLEQLTSPELHARIAAGATTMLVPIGGTEQSGPYLALGKHNERAHLLAGRIAERLGNALVAPVIAYVPEGSIRPPAGHMRFAGTISIPDSAFEAMLEATARSFKQHGVHDVVFLGDHGGYQKNMQRVAEHLNREWAADPSCRVHALSEYYEAAADGFGVTLRQRGYSAAEVGVHAGLADTALTMALAPAMVRSAALAHAPQPGLRDGVNGDPRRASAELGQLGVQQIIEASVSAIQRATRAR